MRRDLAGCVTSADICGDLLLACGKLLPAKENPGLGILLLYDLAEELGRDFVRRSFLVFGYPAQVIKRLNVHREDAFTMQPGLDITPDELPSIHTLIL